MAPDLFCVFDISLGKGYHDDVVSERNPKGDMAYEKVLSGRREGPNVI